MDTPRPGTPKPGTPKPGTPITTIPVGSIVVGTDGSGDGAAALAWAADQAYAERRPLVLLHAVDPMSTNQSLWMANAGIDGAEVVTEIRAASRAILDRAAETVAWQRPDLEVQTISRATDARSALIAAGDEASMVVVGSRGRGTVASLLLGSVSVAVVRHATCPVAVVRPRAEGVDEPHGIVVATDTTRQSPPTLEAAFRLASLRQEPLTTVFCVWDADAARGGWRRLAPTEPGYAEARLAVAETIAGLCEKFPEVDAGVVVVAGSAEKCLVDLAAANIAVVVGRHGSTILDEVGLGSLATAVVEHATGTVVVIP